MNLEIDEKEVERRLVEAGVPEGVRERVLIGALGTLQTNLAMRVEDGLSDEELIEFQKHAEDEDPAEGIAWLLKHFPNYRQMIDEELDKIIVDLKATVASFKKGVQQT